MRALRATTRQNTFAEIAGIVYNGAYVFQHRGGDHEDRTDYRCYCRGNNRRDFDIGRGECFSDSRARNSPSPVDGSRYSLAHCRGNPVYRRRPEAQRDNLTFLARCKEEHERAAASYGRDGGIPGAVSDRKERAPARKRENRRSFCRFPALAMGRTLSGFRLRDRNGRSEEDPALLVTGG